MEILNKELNKINELQNMFYSVDVSKYDQILKVKNDLLREKLLPNIIINNAAGNFLCPFEKLTPNGWNKILDIVLNGGFNIYHIFGKTFIEKKRPATFLNISTTEFKSFIFNSFNSDGTKEYIKYVWNGLINFELNFNSLKSFSLNSFNNFLLFSNNSFFSLTIS